MFNDVFSRDNLLGIKDRAHAINHDGKRSKRTHWVSLFIDRNTDAYFNVFGIEYVPQEVLKKIQQNLWFITHLEHNMLILLRVYFIILLSQNTLFQETLLDYTNLLSPEDYRENEKIP